MATQPSSNENNFSTSSSPGSLQSSASPTNLASSSNPPLDRRSASLVNADGLHKYSCVVCATRKIKCDRRNPCANCSKANSTCMYRAPPPPRRRKKGAAAQSTVLERLKRAEEMLARQQADATGMNDVMWRLGDIALDGQLINHNNSSRYLDNSMWVWLSEELKDVRSVIEDEKIEDDDGPAGSTTTESDLTVSMLFGFPRPFSLRGQHPSPVQIFQLWQLYLQNVHPLMKILHSPTAQQQIIDATGNLDNIPRHIESFMFSMYFVVIVGLTDEECVERFQEGRAPMLTRYRQAAQFALMRADFLTSYSITVLQAFILYLVALRPTTPSAAMWALSGISVRMAHRMGLHRDGEAFGLSVFDIEIRRRLWWEVMFFDGRTAQLSGTGGISLAKGVEFRPPRNINDSELHPGMKSLPMEHDGITEMVLAMVRAEIGNFLLSFPQNTGTFDGSWQGIAHSNISTAEKNRLIDELEVRLDRKFISKCDPLIPQHLLAMTVARSGLSNIRFMAHNPRKAARGSMSDPQEEKVLFDCACLILDQTLFVLTEPSLQRFLYYTRMHVQFLAIVYLLKMLRRHTEGTEAERGWKIIHKLHELEHPILQEGPKSLYNAICDLTLSAWSVRQSSNPGVLAPQYLRQLQLRRSGKYDSTVSPVSQSTLFEAESTETANSVRTENGVSSGPTLVEATLGASGILPDSTTQHSILSEGYSMMDWDDWDGLMQVADFSDFSSDHLIPPPPVGEMVPAEFPKWYH